MGREGIEEGGKEREEEKELDFLERWQLNEAVECGTDGEWLQTQGNYFLAGGMEGARAPSLTGCSLLMDRGDGRIHIGTRKHAQSYRHTHTHTHVHTLPMHVHPCADVYTFATI